MQHPSQRPARTSRRRPAVVAVAAVAVVLLVAAACDSRGYADQRTVPWVNIPIGRITGSNTGAIGIDGSIQGYYPCHDHRAPNDQGWTQDAFYGACVLPSQNGVPLYSSYTYFLRWSGSTANWPSGMFFTNTGTCNDSTGTFCSPKGSAITHGWANKYTELAVELYPDDPAASGVRFTVPCCPNVGNGGAYTPVVGDIDLPRAGNPGTTVLSVSVAGVTAARQVGFDAFGVDDAGGARSSGGVALRSFASGSNGAPGAVGAWSAPALFNGAYAVFITDLAKPNRKVVARLTLPANGSLAVNRNAPCFGLATPYKPATWYLNETFTPADCQALWAS